MGSTMVDAQSIMIFKRDITNVCNTSDLEGAELMDTVNPAHIGRLHPNFARAVPGASPVRHTVIERNADHRHVKTRRAGLVNRDQRGAHEGGDAHVARRALGCRAERASALYRMSRATDGTAVAAAETPPAQPLRESHSRATTGAHATGEPEHHLAALLHTRMRLLLQRRPHAALSRAAPKSRPAA